MLYEKWTPSNHTIFFCVKYSQHLKSKGWEDNENLFFLCILVIAWTQSPIWSSFFSGAKLHWKGYLLSVFWCSSVRFCGLSGICLMEQKHTQSCPWEMLHNNIHAGSLPALPHVTSCLSLCAPQHFLEHLPVRILSQPSHCLWVLWKVSFSRQVVHKPPHWDYLGRPIVSQS